MSDKLKSAVITASIPLVVITFFYFHNQVDNVPVFLAIIALILFFLYSTYNFFLETYKTSMSIIEYKTKRKRYAALNRKGLRQLTEDEDKEHDRLEYFLQSRGYDSFETFFSYFIAFAWCSMNMGVLALIKHLYLNEL